MAILNGNITPRKSRNNVSLSFSLRDLIVFKCQPLVDALQKSQKHLLLESKGRGNYSPRLEESMGN